MKKKKKELNEFTPSSPSHSYKKVVEGKLPQGSHLQLVTHSIM